MSSFSAVSTPIFASKYALESSRRDLHNALLCTALESIIEKWGKKDLAKTTPKKEKTRKREANKRSTANHLELQRSLISKFSSKIAEFFAVFFQNFANLPKFGQIFAKFHHFFSGFFQNAAFFLKDLILAAK